MAKHHHKIYQTRVTEGAKMSWLSNHLLKLYKLWIVYKELMLLVMKIDIEITQLEENALTSKLSKSEYKSSKAVQLSGGLYQRPTNIHPFVSIFLIVYQY